MKVLQVIDTLHTGGAEKMTILLSNLLYKKNVKVELLLLVEKGALTKEIDREINVHVLNRVNRFDVHKMKAVAALASQFDIVHIHLKHNYRYVSLCCTLFATQKPKLILHDHSHTLLIQKGTVRAVKDWLFKSVFKPQYYIGVHQEGLKWAVNKLHIKKTKCFLLENAIEKKQVNTERTTRSGVVMVGNINPIKNIEFTLKLIKEKKENLTIYGNITDETYFKKIKSEITRLQISDRITFVHDCINVQPHLHKYSYALHTAIKETGPLVLLEYLAQGLPFVSHATGQVYHSIHKQFPLFFCNSFNESDWLHKIDNLHLADQQHMEDCYKNNYSTDNYLKECLNIYQDILRS
tara:strand:+ start:585 stop:1637 length:1053 start_codon:yes stop_codon:yes gene_type:complete